MRQRCAPALLAKLDGERALVFRARTNEPAVMSAAEVDAAFTGVTLEVTRRGGGSCR